MHISPSEHSHAARIESGTGSSLGIWVQRIDDADGRALDHAAIARMLPERWEISDWWAQGVAVAYEQVIGRRVLGQRSDGAFGASVSRTVEGDPDSVRARWDAFMTGRRRESLDVGAPSLTDTATWRYWRAPLGDGTRVSVSITARDPGRSTLGLEHKGIETAEGREAWKAAWRRTLTEFTALDQENR